MIPYMGGRSKDELTSLQSSTAIRRLGSKPAALRSIADALGDPSTLLAPQSGQESEDSAQDTIPKAQTIYSCRCNARFYRSTRLGQLSFYKDHRSHHHVLGCPRFGVQPFQNKRTYKIAWSGLSKIVSRTIEISLQISLGAGAWSLAPQITAHRTIQELQDPAFALTYVLNQYNANVIWGNTRHYPAVVHSYFSRLENVYRSRISCVTDYMESGQTILQTILGFNKLPCRPAPSPLIFSLSEQ